ncbi:hypothetical protein ABZ128_13205 [Streptomyces sp. NPDC006326]|uniref:hypothetical protein n=1 Tax=Streptomyces sp. NPDC006326 TaxID=3156752 RepID=UPI0033AD6DB1
MTRDKGLLAALHLFLVWAAMAATVPTLGGFLLVSAWAGGAGAAVAVFAVGATLAVGLLAVAGMPARTVLRWCGSRPQRLGRAVLVFVLGTLGVVAGLAAYSGGVDLGSGGTRIALTGVPYAVAAAFFVPSRWVRLGAVTALASAVAYGGFVGPAHEQQRRHAAEVSRLRERPELQYLAAAPPGMQVSRAEVGPGYFGVDYRSTRQDASGYAGLTVRPLLLPTPQCPEPEEEGVTCTVDAQGEMRTVRAFPDGSREVGLVRRHRDVQVEVSSQTLDERGLRGLLDSLHPLSDAELDELMREKAIVNHL